MRIIKPLMTEQLGTSLNWQTTSHDQTLCLNKSELHIWWLPLNINAHQKEYTLNLLSERQHNKYQRQTNEEKQNAYLAGRYFLLTLLAHYSNCKPADVKLAYSELNKPSLITSTNSNTSDNIQFNFTDTNIDNQHYGLFAFCRQHLVGVDLESCNRSSDFEKIARRRFSETELSYASNTDGTINHQRCIAIWTRKEAYGKAIGKGINFQMNQRNLVSDDYVNTPFSYDFNDGEHDWRLLQLQPSPKFVASIVHQSHQNLEIKAFNRPYQIA